MVTWGSPACGGDSSTVQRELHDVVEVKGSCGAFAARRNDGRVVCWGGDVEATTATELKDLREVGRQWGRGVGPLVPVGWPGPLWRHGKLKRAKVEKIEK